MQAGSYCSPAAPRWLHLNQVARWEVNQEPDQALDLVPSDRQVWEPPAPVHRAAWEHLGLVRAAWAHQGLVQAAWGHLGLVHPVAWVRLGVWDHPVGRAHPEEEDGRQVVKVIQKGVGELSK